MMRSYKDLEVWKISMDFVQEIYKLTTKFPSTEIYGLTNQLRRAAVSIPSNLAEGSARFSSVEFARFINIARGSAAEVNTQLIIAKNLSYINQEELENVEKLCERISIMLFKLRDSLNNNNLKTIKR